MRKPASDELFPRHLRTLSSAARAALDQCQRVPHPDPNYERDLREAIAIVRELAAQHKSNRRHRAF